MTYLFWEKSKLAKQLKLKIADFSHLAILYLFMSYLLCTLSLHSSKSKLAPSEKRSYLSKYNNYWLKLFFAFLIIFKEYLFVI